MTATVRGVIEPSAPAAVVDADDADAEEDADADDDDVDDGGGLAAQIRMVLSPEHEAKRLRVGCQDTCHTRSM
jgi:hypothetical protein